MTEAASSTGPIADGLSAPIGVPLPTEMPPARVIAHTGGRGEESGAVPWLLRIVVAILALAGLAIRIWALGRHAINSDQAVVGLMAHQILHGHFYAFYWGQHYGGGEPYVVALVFALFGQSTFTLGLTPVLLDLCASLLVWRIGRRLFGSRVGVSAALLFWIWPEVYIWQSTIEYGFRWFVLDAGLVALLMWLRIADGAPRLRRTEFFVLGLSLGLGWWGSPEIAYFALPIALHLAYCIRFERLRIRLVEAVIGVVGALIGASAWLEVNLPHGFISLHSAPQPDSGFLHHVKILVQHVVPLLLGLQLRVSGRWLVGSIVGSTIDYLAIGLAIALLVTLARRREALVLVAFCIFAPFIYVLSPNAWYWADGRYAVFLAPAAALVVIVGFDRLARFAVGERFHDRARNTVAAVLPIVLCLALTVDAITQIAPYRPDGVAQTGGASWTSWRADPSGGFAAIAASLRHHHISDLYAGYWVAYPLMFASKNSIVASDISYVRNPALLAAIEADRSAAWLFLDPSDYRLGVALTGVSLMDPSCAALSDRCLLPSEFVRYLDHRGIGYRSVKIAPFVAIVPDRPVSPVVLSTQYHLRPAYSLPG